MAKVLKLVNLKTYTSAVTKGKTVLKNECAKFNDEDAERALEKGRNNAENEFVTYFKEMPDDTPVKYDFTGAEVQTFDVPTEALVAAKRPSVQRRRPSAA